jgi:hypothetical protein
MPSGSETSGADSSDSTSSSDSDFGSERPIFGIAICAVGSSRITPSRTRKRKKRRNEDSCRAVERGRAPASTRQAMKPSRSPRLVRMIGVSRSASQRVSAVRSAR